MAKYNKSKNSGGVCEKIRNATLGSIFCKVRNTAPKVPLPTNNPTSIEIPIDSSPQLLQTRPKNGQVIQVAIVTPQNEPKTRGPLKGQQIVKVNTGKLSDDMGGGGSKNWGEEDVNGKSSVYIDRVKNKMRTKSNVNGENNLGRRESFNDKVSSYINRAKIKLRTTSSIGPGK